MKFIKTRHYTGETGETNGEGQTSTTVEKKLHTKRTLKYSPRYKYSDELQWLKVSYKRANYDYPSPEKKFNVIEPAKRRRVYGCRRSWRKKKPTRPNKLHSRATNIKRRGKAEHFCVFIFRCVDISFFFHFNKFFLFQLYANTYPHKCTRV